MSWVFVQVEFGHEKMKEKFQMKGRKHKKKNQ